MTSREQIVAVARGLIEQDGWEKLTVRKLAAEIGIGATTLYHHVRDKDDLVVLLVNDYAAQIGRPPLPGDPRERIVVAATTMHDVLTSWPWAAEALATDGFLARVDEPALWMVEAILSGAIDHGCTPEQAVHVFRCLWYYTVGETIVRARSAPRRREWEQATEREPLFGHVDTARIPHLAAIGQRWGEWAGKDNYAEGLRAFVDGLLARCG
ncbi:TetR/AcrR family transcriptional regulator [Amycolatopsis suaedae]|uniref:TetR/AcrR family transcriptional regulator n=1 Tax=Amycolatopsis suaedae TaxID=2510978 RepID=A0A4Q7J8T7_9PSEU|nr:TetR/AcrR family transcriptional regulator [Amycolatopsis suaedae]